MNFRYSAWVDRQSAERKENALSALFEIMSSLRSPDTEPFYLQSLGLVHAANDCLAVTPATAKALWPHVLQYVVGSSRVAQKIATALNRAVNTELEAGGLRGYAWEEFISLVLMRAQNCVLHYGDLDGNDDGGVLHKMEISVEQVQWREASYRIDAWTDLDVGTLVGFKREGENRVDLLLRWKDGLIFFECTVGHYESSTSGKVPPLNEDANTILPNILTTVKKWSGEAHFNVNVSNGNLNITPKSRVLRSSPPVPRVLYLVVAPIARHVDQPRCDKYKFIKVLTAQHLRGSGIIIANQFNQINAAYGTG